MKPKFDPLTSENRLDPRQLLMWNSYCDQKSDTFGNAYRSAKKAGFSESYATNITCCKWFRTKVRRNNLLGKAERALDRALSVDTINEKGHEDAALLRVKVDAAKHITKTLGKDDGYSEKTEVTGSGSNVVFLPQELINKFNLGTDDGNKSKTLDSGSDQEAGQPSQSFESTPG